MQGALTYEPLLLMIRVASDPDSSCNVPFEIIVSRTMISVFLVEKKPSHDH